MNISSTCPNTPALSYICLLLKKKFFMLQRIFPAVLFIIVIAFLSACSTKFNIAAPYKNITIVNGLMDMDDTAHYVRVEKAFLDQNQSALTMAQVADSSYYPQLQVIIKEIDVTNNNNIVNTITLNRVDMNAEGYQKQSGTFFTSPNYAYKFTNALNPNHSYRLVVKNPATGEVDSAITSIIDTSQIQVPEFNNLSYTVSLFGTNPNQIFDLGGTLPDSAAMYEGIMRVHWLDSTNTGSVPQYADWNFVPIMAVQTPGTLDLSTACINFYYFLKNTMGAPGPGVRRYLQGVDIYIYAGNSALYNYEQLSLYSGTGITGLESQPTYTNIAGKSVLGLFANRGYKADYNIDFDIPTKDSFFTNSTIDSIVAGLNIVGFKH
jgi:hypothetical protein